MGEHDRDVWDGSEVDVRVIQVLRHDKYDPRRLNNDIAMLYLEKPVQFNKYVSPVCLPKSEVPPGSKCYITGKKCLFIPIFVASSFRLKYGPTKHLVQVKRL